MAFGILRQLQYIGLDIQPDSIHFVRVSKGREWLIEEVESSSLPGDVGVGNKDRYWLQVQAVLIELASRYSFQGVPTAICLPADAVKMQTMMLPSLLTLPQMEAEIRLALQRDMPGLQEPLTIDFSVLFEKEGQSCVFITSVREDYIAKYLACAASVGLQVKIIDVDVSAMQRVLIQWLPQVKSENSVTALLCIKNSSMVFCLLDSQKIIFYQRCLNVLSMEDIKKINIEKSRINQFVLCGFIENVELLKQAIQRDWECECIVFNLLNKVKVSAQIDRSMLEAQQGMLMASLGAVMREMPVW